MGSGWSQRAAGWGKAWRVETVVWIWLGVGLEQAPAPPTRRQRWGEVQGRGCLGRGGEVWGKRERNWGGAETGWGWAVGRGWEGLPQFDQTTGVVTDGREELLRECDQGTAALACRRRE